MMARVILDVDAGVDDIYALLMLMFAEESGDVKIEAITCVRGNTTVDCVYKNIQRILTTNNKQIPIYVGANEPILPAQTYCEPCYYGKDGFGDLKYEEQENDNVKCGNEFITHMNAFEAINQIVTNNPGEISLLCCGPLTNIALAMKINSSLAKNLKEILIMGGNYSDESQKTEGNAEFNFQWDSEAAYIVFNKSECPITVLPKETCETAFVSYYWRFEVLGKLENPIMDLLNKVEKQYFKKEDNWTTYDPFIVLILLNSSIIEKKLSGSVSIELSDTVHKGEMIVKSKEHNSNVTIITKLNVDIFKTYLYYAINNLNNSKVSRIY